MRKTDLQINEAPIYQRQGESVAYRLNTSPWGGSPSSVSVSVEYQGDDVPGVLSGTPTIDGDYIATPIISGLVKNRHYRLVFTFTPGGGVGPLVAPVELIGLE